VSVYKYPLNQNRHSGESRNPVLSRPSGCRIKSGMTGNTVYGQTLINQNHLFPTNAFFSKTYHRINPLPIHVKKNEPWKFGSKATSVHRYPNKSTGEIRKGEANEGAAGGLNDWVKEWKFISGTVGCCARNASGGARQSTRSPSAGRCRPWERVRAILP